MPTSMTLIADGNLVLASLVALVAGMISFASPCVLPLVPGFLGYVTGVSQVPGTARQAAAPAARRASAGPGTGRVAGTATDAAGAADTAVATAVRPGRSRTVLGALLFVAGFSLVFIVGTLLASAAGAALREHAGWLTRAGGVVVILMALVFLGVGSQRSFVPRWRPRAGLAGAPVLGIVFGIGWAPCMGPTYAVIYTLATNLAGDTGLVARGALLGVFYCVGLGVPFLLIAAGWQRAITVSAGLRRHVGTVHLIGGALLLVVGVLLVSGAWDLLVRQIQTSLISRYTTVL